MKIEVLYFDGCPHYLPTVDRLKTVLLREGLTTEITEIEVKDEPTAKALNFFGSPTIRVNGLDIESASGEPAFACRRYAEGLPSEEMIRVALKEARER